MVRVAESLQLEKSVIIMLPFFLRIQRSEEIKALKDKYNCFDYLCS